MSQRGGHNEGINMSGGTINAGQMAVGKGARVEGQGRANFGAADIDAAALEGALGALYEALEAASLPKDVRIKTQTAAGNALGSIEGGEAKPDAVVGQVQRVGETLKQANVTVQEGSALWQSVQSLATLLAPVVAGGAQVVAAWFGISIR